MNAGFLARGDDYREFAAGSYIPFVRDTWESLVVPNHDVWIGLLIVFELAVGVRSLLGGRRTQLAYGLAIAFHLCLLSFVGASTCGRSRWSPRSSRSSGPRAAPK